jgi:hypothetical protein
MPRRPRVFVEGGIYHVYNRFARGAEIFAEPEEAIEFIEILRKARDRGWNPENSFHVPANSSVSPWRQRVPGQTNQTILR